MRFHICTILLVVAAAAASPRPEQEVETYHLKIIDWETAPPSEIEGLINCVLYEKSCNPMRDSIRAVYPGVLYSACELCTTEQKKAGYSFYNRVDKEFPGKLDEFKKKFDPEGKYYEPFYNVLKAGAQ